MKMQIVSCPHCGTFVLDDSAQCHGCGHALDQNRPTKLVSQKRLPTDNAVKDDMEACSNCGEMCRTGLVRCWNCSTFLRPEIEASYRRMQETSRIEIEHIDLPVLEASVVTEHDSYERRAATPESLLAASPPYAVEDSSGDGDFDLSDDAQFGEIDEDSFDLDNDVQFTEQTSELSGPDELESYALQAPAAELPMSPVIDSVETSTSLEPIEPLAVAGPDEPPVQVSEPAEPLETKTANTEVPADDELLKIAADEEKDIQRVRKQLRSKDTFVIFCPQGHRIRVKEKYRGKSGKCPNCQSAFVVPRKQVVKKDAAGPDTGPVFTSPYKKWLGDIRLHTVDPVKLRIKADSLLNECQAVDIGFSADDVIIVTLAAGKFGSNTKKMLPLRQALIDHFSKQGTFEQLTAAGKKLFSKDAIGQFAVAQPAPAGTESLFGDIPVFGTNRIAVRIPKTPDAQHPQYLSFCLSEFRAFVDALQSTCGMAGFGANTAIPLTDEYTTLKCHLGDTKIQELNKLNYYEKDPGFKLEVSGWRCAGCGIVISETGRAAAKLGGANGKALAKAKCPKCTKKFGNKPIYQLVQVKSEQPAVATEAEPAPATP